MITRTMKAMAALSRGQWLAERFATSFQTQTSLDAFCRKYGVSEQYPGAVFVYAPALEADVRVPLHGFYSPSCVHHISFCDKYL